MSRQNEQKGKKGMIRIFKIQPKRELKLIKTKHPDLLFKV